MRVKQTCPPPLSSDMLNKILEAFYLSEPDSDENS